MGWERSGELQTGAKRSAQLSEHFETGFGQAFIEKTSKNQDFWLEGVRSSLPTSPPSHLRYQGALLG